MRVYMTGERVLVNLGTRRKPNWQPGEVLLREDFRADYAPYRKPLWIQVYETTSMGLETFQRLFRDTDCIQDTPQNRKRKGLPGDRVTFVPRVVPQHRQKV